MNSQKNQTDNVVVAIPKLGPVIALDGPAGTGKSSSTKALADRLGFVHVDTGALYRAIAYLTVQAHSQNDLHHSVEIARSAHLEFKREPDKKPANRIYANGKDVTEFIRTPEISMAASKVSAIPEVRSSLLGLQRRLGCVGKSVLEGRDIGTVVFPDADVKFFLTASADERAKRRYLELKAAGQTVDMAVLKKQIEERDHGDSTRATAPLRKAADAIEVDTSTMSLEQVVDHLVSKVKEKLKL